MKTLILSGSPRKNGDTAYLISKLTENLEGEYMIVNCYKESISPCIDCRKCREKPGCVINDGMQKIYDCIRDCDNVVIATPIYFSQPTGKLLDVCSRLQTYFSAKFFRNEETGIKPKRGAVVLAGGKCQQPQPAYNTAEVILKLMNAKEIFPLICSGNTDNTPARDDAQAIAKIKQAADFLNSDNR